MEMVRKTIEVRMESRHSPGFKAKPPECGIGKADPGSRHVRGGEATHARSVPHTPPATTATHACRAATSVTALQRLPGLVDANLILDGRCKQSGKQNAPSHALLPFAGRRKCTADLATTRSKLPTHLAREPRRGAERNVPSETERTTHVAKKEQPGVTARRTQANQQGARDRGRKP